MFDKNKFRARIIECGLTTVKVANLLGISESTLYRKMNDESEFTRSEVQMLRNILALDTQAADLIFFA